MDSNGGRLARLPRLGVTCTESGKNDTFAQPSRAHDNKDVGVRGRNSIGHLIKKEELWGENFLATVSSTPSSHRSNTTSQSPPSNIACYISTPGQSCLLWQNRPCNLSCLEVDDNLKPTFPLHNLLSRRHVSWRFTLSATKLLSFPSEQTHPSWKRWRKMNGEFDNTTTNTILTHPAQRENNN